MSSLIPFSFESHEVCFIPENDSFSVVAKDIADALGYERFDSNLLLSVPEDWKGKKPVRTPGGIQEMLTLSEPGLYFFIGRSDKPKALSFQKWVAGEVLPSIRKTGRYTAPNFSDPLSDFGPKAQFAVLEMLVGKVATEIASGFIDYLRERPSRPGPEPSRRPPATAPQRPADPRPPRPLSPPEPWEAQARTFLADRTETTTTELLAHCGIDPDDQSQSQKNRAAKLLKHLGYIVYSVKRGTRCVRVYHRVRRG